MSKRTFASVTEQSCNCGYLEKLAADPNIPVRYVSEVNEYHLEHDIPQQGRVYVVLYHCPFCGGAAPESRRGEMFAKISDQEATRLQNLVKGIKTEQDALRTLGTPDEDGAVVPGPMPEVGAFQPKRAMTYSRLSTVADIQVTVGSKDEARVVIAPKFIGGTAPKPSAVPS